MTGTQVSLPLESPAELSQSGTAKMIKHWWQSFDDPVLNRLIADALQGNLTLENIWYRLREARAIVDRESSALYPTVNAEAQVQIQRNQSETSAWLLLGLSSSCEVDLRGRIRAGTEAEQYRALPTGTILRARPCRWDSAVFSRPQSFCFST